MPSAKSAYVLTLLYTCTALATEPAKPFDPAVAFGARPSTTAMSLSPDGKSVAYIAPAEGQGSFLITHQLDGKPKRALHADGNPFD